MMNMMNVSVDPCDDFYEYACGGYIKDTALPKGKIVWNIVNKLSQEVHTDLYCKSPHSEVCLFNQCVIHTILVLEIMI